MYIKTNDESYLFTFDESVQRNIIKNKSSYYLSTNDVLLYQYKYYVPAKLRFSIVHYYHLEYMHTGRPNIVNTIKRNFYFINLDKYIELYLKLCEKCQIVKGIKNNKYNMLTTPVKSINGNGTN